MEDIQLSAIAGEQFVADVDSGDHGFIPVETVENVIDIEIPSVEEAETVMEPPVANVEDVVMEEPVVEPEEPILPDHYYDDGNIPVFKPVHSILCYTNS
jgi:hypothetical protein